MQATLDSKLDTIYANYYDNEHCANAASDVEHLRKRAERLGLVVSLSAFALNEVARLTLRSPMFKLRLQNVLFWAAAPTLIARYTYNQVAVERIENLWRVHENREKQGLGGTAKKTGAHESLQQDSNFRLNNGLHVRFDSISHGIRSKPYLNAPFTRFHETIEDYSDFHDDIDDHDLYEIDNWERMKPFTAKQKDVVGNSTVIPMDDNDETLKFYDIQGESLYTNPPNPNVPTVDHGLDEDTPWAFRMTGNNQSAVFNQYTRNLYKASQMSHVPFWGRKLATPVFYRDEKYSKFFKHWGHRLGLEQIKIRHSIVGNTQDPQVRRANKNEIQAYIAKV